MECDKDIKEVFDFFDKNGDGTISAKELGDALKAACGVSQLTDDEIKEILRKADKDGNDTLSLEEFALVVNGCQDEEAFKAFDKDGSGYITKEELKQAMKAMGEKLSDKEIAKLIAKADMDNDGKVCLEEFKKMMAPH